MTLYQELTTGPLAAEIAPHIASGNDGAIYEIMHRKDITSYGWISTADLDTWCAAHNAEYINIVNIAADMQHPFYAAANSILRRLNSTDPRGALDFGEPAITAMFEVWPYVDQTGEAKDALKAEAILKISRADQLPDLAISIETIAQALRG